MASKPVRRLAGRLRTHPELRLRMGTVDVVNGDGTADVVLGAEGTVIPDVQLLVDGTVSAGETVWVFKQGQILVAFAVAPAGAWQAPTLLNGWANFGSGLSEAAYRREPAGVVRLRGVIAGGTTTALTVIFTLPVGYRPAQEEWFAVDTSGVNPAQVRVQADGDVAINNASSTHLSLSGIAFSVV